MATGVAVALVTRNSDPKRLGRVQVRFPWHIASMDSHWARIAVPMAGNGAVSVPEVGDEVLVAFERGDLRFPYVLGTLWNGKTKPPESGTAKGKDISMLEPRK